MQSDIIMTILNMTSGTAIYTIPFSLHESGVILGFLIIISTVLLSFITSAFIIECISISNLLELAYEKQNKKLIVLNTNDEMESLTNYSTSTEIYEDQLKSNEKPIDLNYFMNSKVEITELAYRAFKKGFTYNFISCVLFLYLLIAISANSLLFINIQEQTIYSIYPNFKSSDESESNIYYILLVIYFLLMILLSLNNMKTLGGFSKIIVVIRLIIVISITITLGENIYSYERT